MVKAILPAEMTPTERFAELAELLARGVQRFFAQGIKADNFAQNSQVHLAASGAVEAPCHSRASNPKSPRATR
jgi:hypothetical protein